MKNIAEPLHVFMEFLGVEWLLSTVESGPVHVVVYGVTDKELWMRW